MMEKNNDLNTELLQKILIIQLAKEGVPQNNIARIVGVGTVKVNSLLKHFKSSK